MDSLLDKVKVDTYETTINVAPDNVYSEVMLCVSSKFLFRDNLSNDNSQSQSLEQK